jgi:hypothetical protein
MNKTYIFLFFINIIGLKIRSRHLHFKEIILILKINTNIRILWMIQMNIQSL